jgi:hypothetical protein
MKRKHTCKNKDKNAIIYKWKVGDGYKELENKWTIDTFGFDGNRTLYIIQYCPFCGKKLL